jgi:hypothetical protein
MIIAALSLFSALVVLFGEFVFKLPIHYFCLGIVIGATINYAIERLKEDSSSKNSNTNK